MIIDSLIERIEEMKNPTVVGLDPREDFVPYLIKSACGSIPEAVFEYNKGLIDALCDIVPAVKPQIAFYEIYGAAGVDCYAKTVSYAKDKGMFVIGDIKRGDIASTAVAYADAHISDNAAFKTDFVTVNPYLGADAVLPFVDNAKRYNKGIFVLVRTSNAGAGDIQDLETPGGKVYEAVGDKVSKWGESLIGEKGYSSVCAVVGATCPKEARELRKRLPRTFFLVPGYGAQGGTAEDVKVNFDGKGRGAIINNSRGIIAAYMQPKYKDRFGPGNYAAAAREAAVEMRKALSF